MLNVWLVSTNSFRGVWKTAFFNQMKNGNTITQHIIAKQPQVTHKQYLSEIISTSVGKKQQHRQRLRDCILHAKVVTDIEKNKKSDKRSLKNVIQKDKTGN